MTRADGYTTRQAAYDLRKLRGKNLLVKPGRSRRYQVPPGAARTITALLALRDHVIAPILAGVRSPRPGRRPAHWTRIDRDYENLRIGMQSLFDDLGIATSAVAA
jgi:hypothetical protein